MRLILLRVMCGLMLLQAVIAAGLWWASEYGQITLDIYGFNPTGTTTIWISGGVLSSNWFTGGGGQPEVEFDWFVPDKEGKVVVADFGPVPDVVMYHDHGVPVISGYRFVVPKRTDAWEWPYLQVEIDANGAPQLRKLSLWLVIVLSLFWPLWYFVRRLLTIRSSK